MGNEGLRPDLLVGVTDPKASLLDRVRGHMQGMKACISTVHALIIVMKIKVRMTSLLPISYFSAHPLFICHSFF